jgi:carbon-monoxide dehydrogenase small subunit
MNEITVNGVVHELPEGGRETGGADEKTLLAFLREDLGLTGTKAGCGIGACGSCTVLVDDKPLRSCVTKLSRALGKRVLTIEGMETLDEAEDGLHPLQHAFLEAGAVQCGFCTPGMILSAYALLKSNPHPTREEVREALKRNLCRCTGYVQIVDAVLLAAESLASSRAAGGRTSE